MNTPSKDRVAAAHAEIERNRNLLSKRRAELDVPFMDLLMEILNRHGVSEAEMDAHVRRRNRLAEKMRE